MQQLTGGIALAHHCAMMGEPWIKYNFQKQKMMYLELSWEFAEEMKEAWSSFERYKNEDGEPQRRKIDDRVGEAKRRKLDDGREDTADENKLQAVDRKRDDEKKSSEFEEKKKGDAEKKIDGPMNDALKAATKYKTTYLKCTTESTLILAQIAEDETWSWANNDQNKGKLLMLQNKVNKNHGILQRQFLTEEIGKLKTKVSREELLVSLKNLATSDGKQQNLLELASFLKTIKQRHGV